MMARPDSSGKQSRGTKRVTISEEMNAVNDSADDDFIIDDDDSEEEEGEDIADQIERLYKSYQETGSTQPASSGKPRPQSAQRYLGRPSSAVQEARARPPSAPTPSRGGLDGERVEFRPSGYREETESDDKALFDYETKPEMSSPIVGGTLVDIREEEGAPDVPESSQDEEETKYSDDFADDDFEEDTADGTNDASGSDNATASRKTVEAENLSADVAGEDSLGKEGEQSIVDGNVDEKRDSSSGMSVTSSKDSRTEKTVPHPAEGAGSRTAAAGVSEPPKVENKVKTDVEKLNGKCKKLENEKLRLQSMLEDLRCELTRLEKEKAITDDKNRKLSADVFNTRADAKANEKKLREAAMHWKQKYEEEHRTRALMETVVGQRATANQVRPKSGGRRPTSAGRPLSASVLNSENTRRGDRPRSAARKYNDYNTDNYNRVEAIPIVDAPKKHSNAPSISQSGRSRRATSANPALAGENTKAGRHSHTSKNAGSNTNMVHGRPTPYGTLYTTKPHDRKETSVSESQRLQMAHIQADLEGLRAALRDGSHHATPLGVVRASIMRNR